MRKRVWAAAFAFWGLAAVADETMTEAVGKYGMGILEGADKVESFRVSAEKTDDPAVKAIQRYPITATGPVKDAAFAKKLVAALKAEGVTSPSQKECWFQPHDAFRVWKDKEHVDVLVCFHCDMVLVVSSPPKAPDRIEAMADFDDAREAWYDLCRETMGDDPEFRRMEAELRGPGKKVADWLGAAAVNVIRNIEDLQVCRIDPAGGSKEDGALHGYKVLATSEEEVEQPIPDLVGVLLDEKTYRFESVKGCEFQPGVAFRLIGPEFARVDVLVCFSCDEVDIWYAGPEEGAVPKRLHEDCDGGRDVFLKLAKAYFPEDKAIQELKTAR
jgi:hypothetical protein